MCITHVSHIQLDAQSLPEACTTSCSCTDIQGELSVHIEDAANLPIVFGTSQDNPMPYVSVTAAKGFNLRRITRDSRMATVTQHNSSNLIRWNETLFFGCGRWKFIEVSMWDSYKKSLMSPTYYRICNSNRCSQQYALTSTCLNFIVEIIQDDTDYCSPKPCQNGGTCTDHDCSYQCNCVTGYYGKECQHRQTKCSPSLCLNGGLCLVDFYDVYGCLCNEPYYGRNCESRVWCTDNPLSLIHI